MENTPKEPSLQEAIMKVQGILQEVQVMGANDSEFSEFEQIMRGLTSNTITPAEAITKAQSVRDGKQDYH